MKIQQIRFRNLNSLVGEWTLDLTDPAYGADGIFVITGPTGAGKSTILDAICLALYGRTPRLSVISKSANDILSRQTGDCFAEVTFSGPSGTYRCHWSQQRARKRADKPLQPPKHEIADARSGEVLDASLRGVARLVEEKTGMDFDRFTRSMLLAQGGFAAFLQAHPDERAPILEQITGTQIYSDISIHVHRHYSSVQATLEAEQERYKDLIPLSPEDEQQLRAEHQSLGQQDLTLAAEARRREEEIHWLRHLDRLALEKEALAEQYQQWQEDQSAFAPQAETLRRAASALELSGDHARLVALRHAQQDDRQTQADKLAHRPDQQAALSHAESAHSAADAAKAARQAEQERLIPLLRQVRALDLQRAESQRALAQAHASQAATQERLDALLAQQQADQAAQADHRQSLDRLNEQIAATAADAALVGALSGLEARAETLRTLAQGRHLKGQQITQATAALASAQNAQQTQAEALSEATAQLASTKQQLEQASAALSAHLGKKTEAQWRAEASRLSIQQALLVDAIRAARTRQEAIQTLAQLAEAHAVLTQQQAVLISQSAQKDEILKARESEIQSLETQALLLRRIADLEQARHQLADGAPCPLCGATEHPYASGQIPTPDATEQRLVEAKTALKTLQEERQSLSFALVELAKDLQQNATSQQQQTCTQASAQQALETLCPQITAGGLDPHSTTLPAALAAAHQKLTAESEHIQALLTQADALRDALSLLRDQRDAALQAHQARHAQAQQAAHQLETAQTALASAQSEAATLAAQFTQSLAALNQDCAPYAVTVTDLPSLTQSLATLAERRAAWVQRQQNAAALDKALDTLAQTLASRTEQITQTQSALTQARQHTEALAQTAARQDQERQALFADKDPDAEEQRQAQALAQAAEHLDQTRQTLHASQAALRSLETSLAELEDRLATRQVPLDQAEADFCARLSKAGFPDEATYQASLLPEDQRRSLTARQQELTQQGHRITTQRAGNAEQIATEQAKAVTDQPLATLLEAQTETERRRTTLHQTIGALAQKITDNESLKARLSSHAATIEAHKQEAARWQNLHDLIGSADGKKFRNFAQGLTFDLMVAHANRQLRHMSDRYILRRRQGTLDLDVIDTYQAGESRTTKNLSGGESFIVSLSLALGLSQMASQKTRVDSLFLDEGFGTLDQDALDTALETLGSLYQSGKVIGVISHVPALKDRISTQIHVTPQSGGRSRIEGPGCSFGAAVGE